MEGAGGAVCALQMLLDFVRDLSKVVLIYAGQCSNIFKQCLIKILFRKNSNKCLVLFMANFEIYVQTMYSFSQGEISGKYWNFFENDSNINLT